MNNTTAMEKEQLIKDAQYRKGLGIAFFNATNAAIEIVRTQRLSKQETKKFIVEFRDWLLDEHSDYYAEVIAKIGVPYNAKVAIKKLKAAKDFEALKTVWIVLSEDERRDKDIVKVKNQVKAKYEKTQHTTKNARVASVAKG